jgi:DNA helicase HerA-like ATPase
VKNITTIGRVIATTTTPSLEKIDLVLNNNISVNIERGQFVNIHDKRGVSVLGIIAGIRKHNAYFETHHASIQTNVSRDFNAIFPIDEWEMVLAEVKLFGEVNKDEEKIGRVKYPVSPGSKVTIASSSVISQLLGLKQNGIYLGDLPQNKLEVKPELSRMLRKHLAILAISGAGKSYATSVLLEEIHKQGEICIFLVDPHGEYGPLISQWDDSSRIEIIKGSYVSIGVPDLSPWEIAEFIPEISSVQTRILSMIIKELREKQELYSLPDIIKYLELAENINQRTKEALTGWLYSLTSTYLFSSQSYPNFKEILSPGKIVVLDLADITNIRSRRMITLHFLKNLYSLRTKNLIPPIVFVIEEAHQFCPSTPHAITKKIIETIAREGRKFYASLCLISQRPVNMSVTALSQCNTNLILRIRNPYDLDFIGRISESIDRSSLNLLPSLDIGEALLVGEGINFPIFFRIRKRSVDSQEFSPDFETKAKYYYQNWKSKQKVENKDDHLL